MKGFLVDAAIVGAGPAGSTTAIAILQENPSATVALIDSAFFPRTKTCGDGLSPGVVQVLRGLGLENILHGFDSVEFLAITSADGTRCEGPLPNVGAKRPEGFVIPRILFDDRLRRSALSLGAIPYEGSMLTAASYNPSSRSWNLDFLKKEEEEEANLHTNELFRMHARVLIGADGARSTVRRLLGLPYNEDRHTGIARRGYISSDQTSEVPRAFELHFKSELLPAYAWVFAIDHSSVNIGVGIDLGVYKGSGLSLQHLFERFHSEWTAQHGHERWIPAGNVSSFILPYGSQLPRLSHGCAALVGDAASMVNPMSGDGISYAMRAGVMLGQLLGRALRQGYPIEEALNKYDTEFHARFEDHYKANWKMKQRVGIKFWNNLVIKAYSKDRSLLANAIEVIMGEGCRPRAHNALQVLVKGLT